MILRYLFWGWYAVGLILMLSFQVPDFLHFSNGLFLVFFAIYALQLELVNQNQFQNKKGLRGSKTYAIAIRAVLIGLVTYLLEAVGTRTGYPFGSYYYSNTLSIFGERVPFAIGFAWVGVMSSAILLSTSTTNWIRALQVGFWALLLDLVLDPVAFARGFWMWEGKGIYAGVPWENFAAWFGTAYLLSFLYPLRKTGVKPKAESGRLYQGILLMFGILAVKEGLMIPFIISLIGVAVAEGVLWFDRGEQTQRI